MHCTKGGQAAVTVEAHLRSKLNTNTDEALCLYSGSFHPYLWKSSESLRMRMKLSSTIGNHGGSVGHSSSKTQHEIFEERLYPVYLHFMSNHFILALRTSPFREICGCHQMQISFSVHLPIYEWLAVIKSVFSETPAKIHWKVFVWLWFEQTFTLLIKLLIIEAHFLKLDNVMPFKANLCLVWMMFYGLLEEWLLQDRIKDPNVRHQAHAG